MAVNLIVGVSKVFKMDDGSRGCNVFLERSTMDIYGVCTNKVWLGGDNFESILGSWASDIKQIVSMQANVDLNEKGRCESFSILSPVKK